MKIRMPTDLDPTAGIPRPDQVAAPLPQPMPTLTDMGVPTRSPGAGKSLSQQATKKGGR